MAEQEAVVTELSESEAADAMAKVGLFSEAGPPKKVPPKDPATGKFVKAAATEESSENPEDPEKTEESEATEEKPKETAEEKEARLLKVKLDGMEHEVPEEEVVKGYLRQSDYTKKTQALAEERKVVEAERAEMREAMDYYLSRTQAIEEALEALTPSQKPDWMTASKNMTPEEFTAHYQQWEENQARLSKIKAEHERVESLREQETTKERETRLRREAEQLAVAIPEWKDPEKGKVLREDLTAYAKSLGFSDDDLGNIEDHRALVILHKARLYDESQKRRSKVEDKVVKAVEGLKPSGTAPPPKAKEAAQAKARLLQTGREEDAAEAMRAAKIFG